MAKKPAKKPQRAKPSASARQTSPRAPKKSQPRKPGRRRSLPARVLRVLTVVAIWCFVALALLLSWYALDLPNPNDLASDRRPGVSIVATDGTVLASYGELHGEALHFEDFPPHLIDAVVSTEDRRFFDHFGIDIIGIGRAIVANIRAGGIVQGGSTISQQVAKNLFLTPERSFKRKAQEAMLALWLERQFTKEQILAIYLNRVLFRSTK